MSSFHGLPSLAVVASYFDKFTRSHFVFTLITLIAYFSVWRFAGSESLVAQAFFAEDHVMEWLQVACCVATAVCLLSCFRKVKALWLSWSFFIVAIGMLFIAGEEISWGQRVLNFQFEYLQQKNFQGETNFHNLLPLESNLIPYYGAAVFIGAVMSSYLDSLLSAVVMLGFYIALPMSQHIYFYEYSELWIYGSVLIFTLRLRRNIFEGNKRGSYA